MIKLTKPLNYKGGFLEVGTLVGFLPQEFSAKLIENGAAEVVESDASADKEVESPDLNSLNKSDLLKYAADLGIEGLSDRSTKSEIILRIDEHEQL